VSEKNINSKGVREATQSCVGNSDLPFAWSFTVREIESKNREIKVGVVSATFWLALESFALASNYSKC
jgi:hypothetical protein